MTIYPAPLPLPAASSPAPACSVVIGGLFDTHLHLDPADDAPALLAAARVAGVMRFLLAATDLADARRYQELAVSEAGVGAAIGVHPNAALAAESADFAAFRELARQPGIVAVGEIGLDYYRDSSPKEVQRRVFAHFLTLALESGLPAVVHCREAYADGLDMLREAAAAGLRFVLHSYTGTAADAEQFLALGAYFGFNGIITFPKSDNVRAALAVIPPERILAETDAPYLAPVPYRGRRNQPAYLTEVIRRLALEKGMSYAATTALTTANAERFLGRG